MKFLILEPECAWTSIAWRLQEFEKQDVRMFGAKADGIEHLEGMVKHVKTLEEGLNWVGRSGYILSGDESDMTPLRKRGFKVYGGNAWTNKMENDRIFGLSVAKQAGVAVPNFHQINSVDEAIKFVKSHPDAYALKQTGHAPKQWSYIGHKDDGSDVVLQLEWIKTQPEFKSMTKFPFILQELVEGLELAASAFWMAGDWKRDDDGKVVVTISREHKKSQHGDTGLTCGESGTVALMTTTKIKLFQETVEKYTAILKKEAPEVIIRFDANCGIADEGKKGIVPYLYEITPRVGYPITSLEEYLLNGYVSDFFADLVDRRQGNFQFKKDWGVVTVLGAGRYPFESKDPKGSFKDQPIEFPKWDKHIMPGFVKYDEKNKIYRVADIYEDIANISYDDKDILKASEKCVEAMKSIIVRAPNYRVDIGARFVEKELPQLEKWGYL